MLFGLGVDGVVLMYVAYGVAVARGPDRPRCRVLPRPSVREHVPGHDDDRGDVLWARVRRFPGVRQLGLLIGHSMVACGVLTLVLVPALLPHRPTARSRFSTLEWPRLAGWIRKRRVLLLGTATVMTILLGGAALRLQVNASLDRLRSTTPAAQAEEQVREVVRPAVRHLRRAPGRLRSRAVAAAERSLRRAAPSTGARARHRRQFDAPAVPSPPGRHGRASSGRRAADPGRFSRR